MFDIIIFPLTLIYTFVYKSENYLINCPVTVLSSGSKAACTKVCEPLAADFKINHAIGFTKNLVKLLKKGKCLTMSVVQIPG